MNMIFGDNMLKSFLNIFTNPFSNKIYIETESGLVNENGEFFNKMPNGYMSSNGRFIQQIGNDLMDTKTGKMSSFSDPFEE